jgi:hypothetical protein
MRILIALTLIVAALWFSSGIAFACPDGYEKCGKYCCPK